MAARHAEQVEQLRSAGRLAGARQLAALAQAVERARLAGVGAAGKGHFPALIRRTLVQALGTLQETGLMEQDFCWMIGLTAHNLTLHMEYDGACQTGI